MKTEREAFEAWALEQGVNVEHDGEQFRFSMASFYWEAWQARAALSEQTQQGEAALKVIYADCFLAGYAWTVANPEASIAHLNDAAWEWAKTKPPVALSAQQAGTGEPKRCPYCDDTGDVHGLDGEWRGRCSCPAGTATPTAAVSKTDREWIDFCRPFVYMNGSHEMPNYPAICRAVLALSSPSGEPMYQIRIDGNTAWHDASEGAYDVTPAKERRIVYASPPPSTDGAKPAGELRALRMADMALASWENGYAFDSHGPSREAQRLVTEALAALAAAPDSQVPASGGVVEGDFWRWLNQAYRYEKGATFTEHNMQVAYEAGRALATDSAKPAGEPK